MNKENNELLSLKRELQLLYHCRQHMVECEKISDDHRKMMRDNKPKDMIGLCITDYMTPGYREKLNELDREIASVEFKIRKITENT